MVRDSFQAETVLTFAGDALLPRSRLDLRRGGDMLMRVDNFPNYLMCLRMNAKLRVCER